MHFLIMDYKITIAHLEHKVEQMLTVRSQGISVSLSWAWIEVDITKIV